MRALLASLLLLAAPPSAAKDGCVDCHAKLGRAELASPVAAVRKDVHGAANVSCSGCHGGDASATSGATAHGRGFVARPKGHDAAEICGRCHVPERDNWAASAHGRASADRRADCATCHGAHGIRKASLALISEPLCSSCHPFDAPTRVLRALIAPEREFERVEKLVDAVPDGDGDLKARIDAARSRLRGKTHGLDLYDITRDAARALAEKDAIAAAAAARSPRIPWRSGLVWAVALLVALALAAGTAWLARLAWRRLRGKLPVLPIAGGALVAVAVASVVALAGAGWKAYDYVERDPRFCTSCHLMDEAYSAWQQSAHKDVTCHDCHKAGVRDNLHQLWLTATEGPTEVVKHAVVDRAACESCHNQDKSPAKWNRIAEAAGHKLHAGKERVECVQCHAPAIHRFRPSQEVCAGCHKEVTLAAAGRMAEMHCTTCHNFLAEGSKPLRPGPTACLECHVANGDAPQPAGHAKLALYHAGSKDAPMQWACAECHQPHKQIKLKSEDCAACHEAELESRVHRVEAHSECTDCHHPHGWSPASGCEECHGDEVPKP